MHDDAADEGAAEEAEWHFVEIPSFAVAFSVAFVSFHIVQ